MRKYLIKAQHYFAGNLFNNILLFVFLPFFTHYMVPEEYAVYTNIIIFIEETAPAHPCPGPRGPPRTGAWSGR